MSSLTNVWFWDLDAFSGACVSSEGVKSAHVHYFFAAVFFMDWRDDGDVVGRRLCEHEGDVIGE